MWATWARTLSTSSTTFRSHFRSVLPPSLQDVLSGKGAVSKNCICIMPILCTACDISTVLLDLLLLDLYVDGRPCPAQIAVHLSSALEGLRTQEQCPDMGRCAPC